MSPYCKIFFFVSVCRTLSLYILAKAITFKQLNSKQEVFSRTKTLWNKIKSTKLYYPDNLHYISKPDFWSQCKPMSNDRLIWKTKMTKRGWSLITVFISHISSLWEHGKHYTHMYLNASVLVSSKKNSTVRSLWGGMYYYSAEWADITNLICKLSLDIKTVQHSTWHFHCF